MVKRSAILLGTVLTALASVHCSSPTGTGEDQSSSAAASSTAMVKTISSSYGITTFGGPGEYQSTACGGNTKTINKWYVASSQRYGCHVHLKLTASNGKCVVVSTEDAGPAAYVEKAAGEAVLDSSPAVGDYLFGETGLGSSDIKSSPSTYTVSAAKTSEPLGPCADSSPASSTTDSTDASDDPAASSDNGTFVPTTPSNNPPASGSSGASGDDDDAPPVASGDDDDSGGGTPCGSDGQCNPGNNGSGLICSGGFCVPGCHTNAQCPGVTTCQAGQCE